jgi:bifunctional non-homologous end joining protein LigD
LTFTGQGSNFIIPNNTKEKFVMGKNPGEFRFVVHEHHATHLHYDFRLEMEGVLKSWAIPKGPSMNPSEKRLAIMVEDHLLEYGKFEGIIPEGQYGAGAVVIWDEGTYVLAEGGDPQAQLKRGKFNFELRGRKLKGGFSMALLRGRGKGNQWLLMKRRDEKANPAFKLEVALTEEKGEELELKTPPCETDFGPFDLQRKGDPLKG